MTTTYVAGTAILACIGLLFLWDSTRAELVRTKAELSDLERTREADIAATERIRREHDEIARRYEALSRELMEAQDDETVEYLNTPVPNSVRRLLERK